MVMNRGTSTETPPATRPARDGETLTEPEEDLPPAPVYISIDGVPYEFPPAKLWLKRSGSRVRAQLFSDDPPEALDRDWSGDSFYFEMDMELPREMQGDAAGPGGVDGEITAEELASAEWIFQSPGSQRADTRSGIFLGAAAHLQPITVSVLFDPLDEETVMVTLEGLFAEFDQSRPHDTVPKRQVRVQAALSADAIRR